MALFYGDQNIIPHSISAKTKSGLERKIHERSKKLKAELKFINFYYDPKKKEHVGWYYFIKDEQEQIQEFLDGRSKE